MANLQPSESRIPDTWFITLTFSLIVTFYLVKHKNRTLCLYLHTKFQVCSIGQTSFRQTVGKEGLGSAPNPTAKQTSKKLALIRVVTHPKNFDSLHSWSIGRPKLIHQLLILQCNTQSRSTFIDLEEREYTCIIRQTRRCKVMRFRWYHPQLLFLTFALRGGPDFDVQKRMFLFISI